VAVSRAFDEALRDAKAALDAQHKRERDLIGRWALPSGLAFKAKRIDPTTRLVLCCANGRCWDVPVGMLLTLLKEGELRWLGK